MALAELRINPGDVVSPAWEACCPKCESGYFCEEEAEDPGQAPCPSCVSENAPEPGVLNWVPIVESADYPDLSTQPDFSLSWGCWTIWSGNDPRGPEVAHDALVQVYRRSSTSSAARCLEAAEINWEHTSSVDDVLLYRVEKDAADA